jgi:hypothetical protein
MKTRVFLIGFAVALAGTASAFAQLRGGTWELNGFAGYLVGGDYGHVPYTTDYPYSYDLNVGDDLNYGGRLGYNFNSLFEVEFEYARTDTNFDIHHYRGAQPPDVFNDLTIQYFMGYMTFNFGHGRGVPYFTIGGGAGEFRPSLAGFSGNTRTGGTAAIGGGYKYFFNPHFAIRGDGRLYSTSLGSHRYPCSPYYYCTDTNWVTNFVVNGGIIVAF